MIYSQNNEQQIIANYFNGKIGTFLDIGANDGVTLSNTYQLVLDGWGGCSIEPSKEAYKNLIRCYERSGKFGQYLYSFPYAISDMNGQVTLHESGTHLKKGDTALLSTIKPDEMNRWAGTDNTFTPTQCECVTFATFLDESPIKTFDFISMDIEGAELTVLPQMDLNALGCKMIIVEFNGKEEYKYNDIIIPQGFKQIAKNAENLIYAKPL